MRRDELDPLIAKVLARLAPVFDAEDLEWIEDALRTYAGDELLLDPDAPERRLLSRDPERRGPEWRPVYRGTVDLSERDGVYRGTVEIRLDRGGT